MKIPLFFSRPLALFCVLLASAAPAFCDDPPAPTVTITGGWAEPIEVLPEEEISFGFSGSVNNAPQGTSECKITGPDWSWSVSAEGGTVRKQENGESVTAWVKFATPGTYMVSASATATYHSDCGGSTVAATVAPGTGKYRVSPKNWDVGTPIGEERTANGGTRYSGRMTAPQDRTKLPFQPQIARVRVGAKFSAGVEMATDIDHWSQFSKSGNKPDPIPNDKYVWTASSAIFGTAVRTPDNAGSYTSTKTGLAVAAVAPLTTGNITLTYTADDTPTAKGATDTGSRDDDPLTSNLTIEVYDPASWVQVNYYRNIKNAAGEEVPGEMVSELAGGKLWREVIIQVGAESRIKEGQTKLEFDIEENSSEHTDGTNVMRLENDLTTQWQKLQDGEWTGLESPLVQNNDSAPCQYRSLSLDWDTTKRPLGHNGTHTVSLPQNLVFEVKETDGSWTARSFNLLSSSFDVQNLVVPINTVSGNMGNPDYIVYAPDSGDNNLINPSIKFTIQDKGDPHLYKYYVHLKEVNAADWDAKGYHLLTQDSVGAGEINVPWTPFRAGVTEKIPAGVYTFDIHVTEFNGTDAVIDDWWLKTPYNLKIPTDNTALPNGHVFDIAYDEDKDAMIAKGAYVLHDEGQKTPKEMQIDVFSPDLKVKATVSGDTLLDTPHPDNAPEAKIDLYTLTADDEGGMWRGIWRGGDGHGSEFRDHLGKRMLAMNAPGPNRHFYIEYDWLSFSNDGVAGNTGNGRIECNPLATSWQLLNAYGEGKWQRVLLKKESRPIPTVDQSLLLLTENKLNNFYNYNFNYRKNELATINNRVTYVFGAANNSGDSSAIGSTRPELHRSTIYVEASRVRFGDERVILNTIHEVGHSFFGPGHQHGLLGRGDLTTNITNEEQDAWNESNIEVLKRFRGQPSKPRDDPPKRIDDPHYHGLTRSDPRLQFLNCVYSPVVGVTIETGVMSGYRFCEFHLDTMSDEFFALWPYSGHQN